MKKGLIITLLILVGIQFIRIDKNKPPILSQQDYVVATKAPQEVKDILKKSCYDCHSNEVIYPWYSDIAPISWFIKSHINEGRNYLNFSEYAKYNEYQKPRVDLKLLETTLAGSMPLGSYLLLHKEAELTSSDREILRNWFKQFVPQYQESNYGAIKK